MAAWWQEVFGGPPRYTGDLGGYAHMVDKHRNLAISVEQRRRFVETMSIAANDAGLPADPEFRSALLAYLEWRTPESPAGAGAWPLRTSAEPV